MPSWAAPAVLLGGPAAFAIACWIEPAFYHQVVWRYLWGPIVADAAGAGSSGLIRGGVTAHPGYNAVNTLVLAILFVASLLVVRQALLLAKVPVDRRLVLGASGWVAAGALFHVLEDTGWADPPAQYLLITPLIHLLFAAGVLAAIGIGILASKRWPIRPATVVAWGGLSACAMATGLLVVYALDPWPGKGGQAPDGFQPLALIVLPLAALPVALLAAWAMSARIKGRESLASAAFLDGVNLLIVGCAALDAFSTMFAVELLGYDEKHVVSGAVIAGVQNVSGLVGWSFGVAHPVLVGFVPLKLGVATGVVYLLNVTYHSDEVAHPGFYGLVRFALVMDGLGPGLRGFVRLLFAV